MTFTNKLRSIYHTRVSKIRNSKPHQVEGTPVSIESAIRQ